MKITDIRLRRLKLIEQVGEISPAWSPGDSMRICRGGGAFVEIATDEGITGIGPEIDDRFLPVLKEKFIGRDPLQVRHLNGMLDYYLPGGTYYKNSAGVDIALWDIVGKHAEQPLYRLWGGSDPRIVPYAAMVKLSEPEERAGMAAQLRDEGWRAIKLRLHHETMKEDLRTVERVRRAVGDSMAIMVDANQAQSKSHWQPGVRWDYGRALATGRELEQFNCRWLEEPLPRYAFEDLRRLGENVSIPLAGGENQGLLFEFEEMCRRGTYNVLQPEVLVLSGITETLMVGELARQHGCEVVPHNGYVKLGLIAHMHMVASWPHAPYLELIHDPPVADFRHFTCILSGAPTVQADGTLEVPQGPGLGVSIDPDLILPDGH